MAQNTGHGVLTLHRVKYGEVSLDELPEGETREIAPDSPEGRWAQALLHGGSRQKKQKQQPQQQGGGGKGQSKQQEGE